MTDKLRQAAQQALEALEAMNPYPASKEDQRAAAITALRAALAEPQDPVAYNGWVLREVLFDNGEPVGHREPTKAEPQEPVYSIEHLDKAYELGFSEGVKAAPKSKAEPQEPVAWMYFDSDGDAIFGHPNGYRPDDAVPVYTAPQPAKLSEQEKLVIMQRIVDSNTGFIRNPTTPHPAKPAEQEPVAWYGVNIAGVKYLGWKYEELDDRGFDVFPLYTAPQPAKQPLTDEQVDQAYREIWRNLPIEFGHTSAEWIEQGIKYAERAHGIGSE